MQYHNDDMDELFRRAAEDYPLNTHNANWDKVNAVLSGDQKERQNNDKRNLLWLLLLLPLVLICNRVVVPGNGDMKLLVPNKDVAPMPATVETTKPVITDKNTIAGKKQLIDLNENEAESKSKSSQPTAFTYNGTTLNNKYAAFGLLHGKHRDQNITKPSIIKDYSTIGPNSNNYKELRANSTANSEKQNQLTHSDLVKDQVAEGMGKTSGSLSDMRDQSTLKTGSDSTAIQSSTAKEEKPKQKRFYAGVMGGPDISTVKFQQFSDMGFEAGIILGYDINKKFSVEAGIFTDKKYYSSEGEYLNSAKVYVPANSKITHVAGNCRMIELPLNIKYNISTNAKRTLFATAGISSYLMKKEEYSYDYLYYSTGRTATYDKSYDNATKNWFSVLQFSVGYSKKIGRIGDLRIEPYYKLPLKGLGYGDLPISSLGIRFGITRNLF